ncbi:hypothetical protein [Saccharopolyspora rosea]|uniref:Uncharacterized protein n=1 Tax=Saccharopolyspora rosea TaxID=524884 RepID=A0ABW3FV12_9PSEU|nr:hypothetical protein [Saccharopolyspora rosea]
MRRTLVGAAAVVFALTGPVAVAAPADDWQFVGPGMTSGISGIALADGTASDARAVVVRDNKKPGENRAALVDLHEGELTGVRPLAWHGELPVDLEAIGAVPQAPGEYVALASSGRAFHIRLDRDAVTVLGAFPLPQDRAYPNYEGFGLARIGGGLVAVWAERGDGARPGTLYAATFDAATGRFGRVRSVPFRAPFPTADVRHVSDLQVRPDGAVLVSSASDPGDDGPFQSALYVAGRVVRDGDEVSVAADHEPRELARFDGHKVEGITGLGDGVLVGSDDENLGGSVRVVRP